MIDIILNMLELDKHYAKSKYIDIAKGVNKVPMSFYEAWEKRKRIRKWQI